MMMGVMLCVRFAWCVSLLLAGAGARLPEQAGGDSPGFARVARTHAPHQGAEIVTVTDYTQLLYVNTESEIIMKNSVMHDTVPYNTLLKTSDQKLQTMTNHDKFMRGEYFVLIVM